MTLEESLEGDTDVSPPIPRATLLGHVSHLRSTPNLLKLNQHEATCRRDRGGSLSVGPGTKLTVSRASSPQLRSTSRSSLKQDNTVGRSQSMRTAQRPRSLEPSSRFRQRIASIPVDMALQLDRNLTTRSSSDQTLLLPVEMSDLERLRNFSVTSKGVINRGDSFRSKSWSNHSISSVGSQPPPGNNTPPSTPNLSSVALPGVETPDVPPVIITESVRYRVLISGSPAVGISSLTSQFLTSEYICAYETSQAEVNEKSVTIVLNGQETELLFVEHSLLDNMPQVLPETSTFDAFAVIYSVTNKHSFQHAKNLLQQIRDTVSINSKAVILVGNKSDLVRLRVVTSDEGRAAAIYFNCKFIETSAGINHHVDELLVGILTQIRLKLQHPEKVNEKKEKSKSRSSLVCPERARGFIKRILRRSSTKSRLCDNLNVL